MVDGPLIGTAHTPSSASGGWEREAGCELWRIPGRYTLDYGTERFRYFPSVGLLSWIGLPVAFSPEPFMHGFDH